VISLILFTGRHIIVAIDWQLVFSGLTAVGTVGAVIVSLWLSSQNKPKLRVSATKRFMISFNDDPNGRPYFLVLEVTNIGGSPVNVIQFLWRTGLISKQYAVQIPDNNPYALNYDIKLPKILHPGEQARCFLRYENFFKTNNNYSLYSPKMGAKIERMLPLWVRSRFWKIGVDTTLGQQNYWATVSKALQRDIIKLFKSSDVRKK
jgi:hypothetical protein